MQSNELRIGNWIQCNIVRLGNLKKGDYHQLTISDFNYNLEDYFRPILLTEEWLIKFGFEDVDTGRPCLKISDGWEVVVPLKNTDKEAYLEKHYPPDYSIGLGASSSDLFTNIRHVNQLQNLYFALTGEELTIKE